MATTTRLEKTETALLFTMGMAIFLSKPAIYLVSLLLLVLTVLRLVTNQNYRREVFNKRLFWASTGLFFLGVAATAIGSSHPDDVGWMAKKTMLLPMAVPFLIAFAQPINRTAGLSGVLVGFWIAFVLTGNMHNWSWHGGRLQGATWLVDAWGVICAMLLAFLTPLAFMTSQKKNWRIVLAFTILAALIILITTGARGAWLGVACGVFLFLLAKHRSRLIFLSLAGVFAVLASSMIWPNQTDAFKSRIASIGDINNNASNYVRLALWETGVELIKNKFHAADSSFWVGMGHEGHVESSTEFYRNDFGSRATVRPGLLDETLINDFHNMYIQSIIQNGILWTAGILIFLTSLCIGQKTRKFKDLLRWESIPSVVNFLVIGITYTVLPHFAFMFLIYFLTLIRGYENRN